MWSSFSRRRPLACLIVVALSGGSVLTAQTDLEDTLSTLEQWVEMERRIADESARWETERESLKDLLKLYQEELDMLEAQIQEAESDVSAAEAERADLNRSSERLTEIESSVEGAMATAETALKALHPHLPRPLQEEIQPVFSQLPKDSQDTDYSIGQRIQFIVASLTQIQKFNTAVVVEEDFRAFEAGNQVQIDAIYFGLGSAYYVDKADTHAGYAVLTEGGWEWRDDDTIAPAVRDAVDIYRSNQQAEYVPLPVEIR